MPDNVFDQKKLDELRTYFGVPGLAVAFTEGSFEKPRILTSGIRRAGYSENIEASDKFQIASCNKSMTALLYGIMVERGYIQWDSTLGEIFTQYPEMEDKYIDMSFREVLAHLGSFCSDYLEYNEDKEMIKLIKKVIKSPLKYDSSKVRHTVHDWVLQWDFDLDQEYSNVGYDLIGNAIETVYNRNKPKSNFNAEFFSFEEILQLEIFDKLNLTTCGFGPPTDPSSGDQPWGHQIISGRNFLPSIEEDLIIQTPAGRVHGTLPDIYGYLVECYKGYYGNSKLMKKEQFRKIFTLYDDPDNEMNYGHGWFIEESNDSSNPTISASHDGSDGFSQFTTYINFQQKKVVAIGCNAEEGITENGLINSDIGSHVLDEILLCLLD